NSRRGNCSHGHAAPLGWQNRQHGGPPDRPSGVAKPSWPVPSVTPFFHRSAEGAGAIETCVWEHRSFSAPLNACGIVKCTQNCTFVQSWLRVFRDTNTAHLG